MATTRLKVGHTQLYTLGRGMQHTAGTCRWREECNAYTVWLRPRKSTRSPCAPRKCGSPVMLPPPITSVAMMVGVHESPTVPVAHAVMTSAVTRAASALLSTLTRVVTTTDPALTLTVSDDAGTPSAAETLAMYSSEGKLSTVVLNVDSQVIV